MEVNLLYFYLYMSFIILCAENMLYAYDFYDKYTRFYIKF
jgi:hypothetical protein